MRPGAPLSPGLISKTRNPLGWFTSRAAFAENFFYRLPGQCGWQIRRPMAWKNTRLIWSGLVMS